MRRVSVFLSLMIACTAMAWSTCATTSAVQRIRSAAPITMLAKKSSGKRKSKQPASAASSARGFARQPSKAATPQADSTFVPLPPMTRVIFESPSVEVTERDGAKAVCATQNIAPGEVLLVEHVVSGAEDYVLNCVLNDGPLFDVLYPRTTPWSVKRLLNDELESMVCDKVDANGFVGRDGTVAVGQAISAFNHADQPQAIVSSLSLDMAEMAVAPRVLYVRACSQVEVGQEVEIQYRDTPSMHHPYVGPSTSVGADSSTGSAGPVNPTATENELQAAVEAVQGLVVDYTSTEAFVDLCVAHDRLYRALAQPQGD